jgi:cytochrome c5
MFKTTLLAALFTLAGIAAHAQTSAASAAAKPAASAAPAAPAAAASAAKPAAAASGATADPEVKKSNAGICHEKTSNGYKQTKNFTPFKTMDECIKSGGRAPKK